MVIVSFKTIILNSPLINTYNYKVIFLTICVTHNELAKLVYVYSR